jgi:hypothetical protein
VKDTRVVLAGLVIGFIVLTVLASRCEDDRIAEGVAPVPEAPKVVYPRDRPDPIRMSKRMRKPRRRGSTPLDTERARSDKRVRDRLEAAMSAPGGGGSVFVELNAIRHSEVANKILKCRETEAMGVLDDFKERLNIDPSKDIDRVAISGESLAVSGYFKDITLPPEVGDGVEYGGAKLYETPGGVDRRGNPRDPVHFAVVGEDMVVTGPSAEAVKASVDRIEGRGEVDRLPAIAGARGEIYGTFGAAFVAGIVGGSPNPMAQKIATMLDGGVIRMDIQEHVSMSLDLSAKDPDTGRDLAQTVGGLFAAARIQAQEQGNPEVAQLLEQARVIPADDGTFDVDVAVPGEMILNALGCDEDGNPVLGAGLRGGMGAADPQPNPSTPDDDEQGGDVQDDDAPVE